MRRPEQDMQRQFVALLRLAGAPESRWTAIESAGRGARQGAYMKANGVNKGWPDVLVLLDGGILAGIEFKRPDGKGKLRPSQKEWADTAKALGAKAAMCTSVEQALMTLRGWGFKWAGRIQFTSTGAAVIR